MANAETGLNFFPVSFDGFRLVSREYSASVEYGR